MEQSRAEGYFVFTSEDAAKAATQIHPLIKQVSGHGDHVYCSKSMSKFWSDIQRLGGTPAPKPMTP